MRSNRVGSITAGIDASTEYENNVVVGKEIKGTNSEQVAIGIGEATGTDIIEDTALIVLHIDCSDPS